MRKGEHPGSTTVLPNSNSGAFSGGVDSGGAFGCLDMLEVDPPAVADPGFSQGRCPPSGGARIQFY